MDVTCFLFYFRCVGSSTLILLCFIVVSLPHCGGFRCIYFVSDGFHWFLWGYTLYLFLEDDFHCEMWSFPSTDFVTDGLNCVAVFAVGFSFW